MPAPPSTLFAYGSLLFPEVWELVVGRETRSAAAQLGGFRAFTVAGATFPGLVAGDASAQTSGRLYFELGPEDWRRLDEFEDTFYQRQAVTARTGDGVEEEAQAYVVPLKHADLLSDTPWTAAWFEEHALAEFVDRISRFGLGEA